MKTEIAGDVSELDTHSFGPRSLTWWGTLSFISLESSAFALAAGSYLYLMARAPEWPLNSPLPNHWPGTIVTLLLLFSVPLNLLVSRWAHQENMPKVRWGLVGMSLFGIAPLLVRIFEFPALNVFWDQNAYGSVLWFLLGLHTAHLLTDLGDTLVLAALMFTRHGQNGRRFSDVTDNAFYWNFVVLAWLPMYVLIYWIPVLR
jgi:cytochrome c oxidase subunit 3